MIFLKQVQRSKTILRDLLRSGLCFKGIPQNSVLHNTHVFPFKFHSALPRLFIEALTQPGELILDPMCGSGTTLIEAALTGRVGFGLDCDPLAVKLSRMKTNRLDPGKMKTALYRIVNNAFLSLMAPPDVFNQLLQSHYSEESRHFFREHFCEESLHQLVCLIQEIQRLEEPALKNFFEVVFSSVIMTSTKRPRDTVKFFLEKGSHAMHSMQEFQAAHGNAVVAGGDARILPIGDNTIDLVMTAPPYGNPAGGVLSHRSSLYWLGVKEESLTRYHHHSIGIQAIRSETRAVQQDFFREGMMPAVDTDRKEATVGCILGQYFQDMAQVLSEMNRVLKPGKAAIMVVGTLRVQGIILQPHEILSELAEAVGFQWIASKAIEVGIDNQNHPNHRTKACTAQEYVIGLVKRGS